MVTFSNEFLNFMETLRHLEIWIEAVLSLPAFLLNIYSIVKLKKLDALFPNLRIVLTMSCSSAALISLLHPIQHLVPPSAYSIAEGRYIAASLYYISCFISHVCFILFEYKYLIIAYERKLAMRYRKTYENVGEGVGKRLCIVYILIASVITTTKIVLYLFDDVETDIDKVMHRAFFVEGPASFFITCYFLSLLAWLFSFWEIHQFSKKAERTRHSCKSLSESFQLRQIILVLKMLKPLSLIFFLGALFTGACLAFSIVVLWNGYNEHNPSYKAAANGVYVEIAAYNLFATIYLLLYFEPMQKLLRKDLYRVFKVNPISTSTKCAPAKTAAEIQLEHFETLKSLWRPKSA